MSAAGTFHSVGCQIVKRHVAQLGDTGREAFAIFDQDDTKNVMKLALKKHFKLVTDDSKQTAASTEAGAEAGAEGGVDSDALGIKQAPEWVSKLCQNIPECDLTAWNICFILKTACLLLALHVCFILNTACLLCNTNDGCISPCFLTCTACAVVQCHISPSEILNLT